MYKILPILTSLFLCVKSQEFNCNLNGATDCNSVEKKQYQENYQH